MLFWSNQFFIRIFSSSWSCLTWCWVSLTARYSVKRCSVSSISTPKLVLVTLETRCWHCGCASWHCLNGNPTVTQPASQYVLWLCYWTITWIRPYGAYTELVFDIFKGFFPFSRYDLHEEDCHEEVHLHSKLNRFLFQSIHFSFRLKILYRYIYIVNNQSTVDGLLWMMSKPCLVSCVRTDTSVYNFVYFRLFFLNNCICFLLTVRINNIIIIIHATAGRTNVVQLSSLHLSFYTLHLCFILFYFRDCIVGWAALLPVCCDPHMAEWLHLQTALALHTLAPYLVANLNQSPQSEDVTILAVR